MLLTTRKFLIMLLRFLGKKEVIVGLNFQQMSCYRPSIEVITLEKRWISWMFGTTLVQVFTAST